MCRRTRGAAEVQRLGDGHELAPQAQFDQGLAHMRAY
jgi:hypothetical protein